MDERNNERNCVGFCVSSVRWDVPPYPLELTQAGLGALALVIGEEN